MSLIRQ